MHNKQLSERFQSLWQLCSDGASAPASVWSQLQAQYSEPHRFYHNLDHISHCLNELDAAGEEIAEPQATEMAIWFHDIIYRYSAKDNEALSADLFRNAAAAHMPAAFIERVNAFILATQHIGSTGDSGTALMVDIDLSGFGLPWDGYFADSLALRKEAPDVSDEQYFAGKLRFLDALLQWPQIFQSPYFHERLEETARSNIKRFSADLRSQGFGD